MINVAFFLNVSDNWLGGLNYYKNLIRAISLLPVEQKKIKPIVFLGKKTDEELKNYFKNYSTVIKTSILDKYSIMWFLHKFFKKVFLSDIIIKIFLLKKFNIDIISHSDILLDKNAKCKTLNWIPDFQHIHLPNMFTKKEYNFRNKYYKTIISDSNGIIVSSNNAYNDFKKFLPAVNLKKIFILNFVPFLDKEIFNISTSDFFKIKNKYNITEDKFFYLPNQFWKHKNHMVVFKAINELKKIGINVIVICSGKLHDYRNVDYINQIKNYIKENNLESNIKLIGVIPYIEVLIFMKYSIAVINPSLFEGWSTTAEECKIINKKIILSDIPVHKEQNPNNGIFFNPNDFKKLALILNEQLNNADTFQNNEKEIIENNEKKVIEYAKNYQDIILNLLREIDPKN